MSHQEQKIQVSLTECGALLGKLSATCCQPGKSQSMNDILSIFSTLSDRINQSSGLDVAETSIELSEKCGASIGALYVSCCSPRREKIYQQLLSKLNEIFLLSWQIKKLSH